MSEQQASPADQINALTTQLTAARGEAYEARTALDQAEEKIKAIKNALQGASLGMRFAEDKAKAEADAE